MENRKFRPARRLKHSEKWLLLILFLYFVFWRRNCSNNLDVVVSIEEVVAGKPIQLQQNDPRIVKYIWDNHLIEHPSTLDYNLTKSADNNPSLGQAQYVQRILGNITNGFFVEAGALDGEILSNSLFLEMHMAWKGLLVEGDPSNYELVKQKNRKAYISRTCLAIHPYPHQADYRQEFNTGKILASPNPNGDEKNIVSVQCMPLASLLAALNVTTVDYFSLDVEGSELQVLKTIPFDQVFIKTLSVEFAHTTEGKESLLNYMTSKGYNMVREIHVPRLQAEDFIFVHKSIVVDVD